MRKTFCDRCHEEIASSYETRNTLIKETGLSLQKQTYAKSHTTDDADLCNSCGKSLKQWFDSHISAA